MTIKAKISAPDDAGQVAVTFTAGKVTHKRQVNAVFDAAGKYDKAATAARVDQVGAGVLAKIAAGAIG